MADLNNDKFKNTTTDWSTVRLLFLSLTICFLLIITIAERTTGGDTTPPNSLRPVNPLQLGDYTTAASAVKETPFITLLSTEYQPSAVELEWGANIHLWHTDVCKRAVSDQWLTTFQVIINVLAEQDEGGEDDTKSSVALSSTLAEAEHAGYLSHMVYKYSNGVERRVALEPLIGLLRDHRSSCQGDPGTIFTPSVGYWEMMVDKKMWIIMDPERALTAALGRPKMHVAPRAPAYARALMFDMGGSRFMHAQGGRWIMRQFSRMGIHFDHVYVWEATPTTTADYYAGAPADALHRVHFFNWPVTTEIDNDANPFTLVKKFATPEDFVVVKLDIDTPSIENALANQLLGDRELQLLVDEFYFEHHVHMKDFVWPEGTMDGTLMDSYRIFTQLRNAGITAHSWP